MLPLALTSEEGSASAAEGGGNSWKAPTPVLTKTEEELTSTAGEAERPADPAGGRPEPLGPGGTAAEVRGPPVPEIAAGEPPDAETDALAEDPPTPSGEASTSSDEGEVAGVVYSGDVFTALVGNTAGTGLLVSDTTRGETDGAAMQAASAAARAALASALVNSVEVSEGAADVDPDHLFHEAWVRCVGRVEKTLAEVLEVDLGEQSRPAPGEAAAGEDNLAALADATWQLREEQEVNAALQSRLAELQSVANGASALQGELDSAVRRLASAESERNEMEELYVGVEAEARTFAVRLKEAEARGSTAASLTDMPLNAKSEELQATVKQLEARIQALVSEVETKDALVEELRQEAAKAVARSDSQLQRELEQLKLQSAETAKAQAAAAKDELEATRRELESSRKELAQMEETCKALTASTDEAKLQLEQSVSAAREERSQSEKLLAAQAENLKSLEAELEAQGQQEERSDPGLELAEALTLREEEVRSLTEERKKLLPELEALRSRAASKEEALEALETTSKVYQDELTDMKEKLGTAEEALVCKTADHGAALELLREDIKALELANTDMSSAQAESGARENSFRRELESLQEGAEELNRALAVAADREGALTRELDEKNTLLDSALKDVEALQVAAEEVEARSTSALTEMERDRDSLQRDIHALNEERRRSTAEVTAQVDALEAERRDSAQEKAELERDLAETERVWRARCSDIEGQMENLIHDMRVKTDSREDVFSQERLAWKQKIRKLEERLGSVQRMVEVKGEGYKGGGFRPAEDPGAHVEKQAPDLMAQIAQLEEQGRATEAQTVWTQAALKTLVRDIQESLGEDA